MYPANAKLNAAQIYLLNKAKEFVQNPNSGELIPLFKEYLMISHITVEQYRAFDDATKEMSVAFIKAMLVTAKASLGLYAKA